MAKFSIVTRAQAMTLFALFSAGHTFAAGPVVTQDQFPDYKPSHTVIKCPYIPEGLGEIPVCGGQPATCVGTEGRDLILGRGG
jgi:hypothetical protein